MTPEAKPAGMEWCKTCKNWRRHDSASGCYGCGRKLLRESSTFDMMAQLEAKGYLAQ